jgi:predicted O-linked N-acetylglucosamine transferase (SPINDLY family)
MTNQQKTAADLQAALQHHQRGELKKAELIYRRILKTNPRNSDALNLLGAIAYQEKRGDAAVDLISRAIAINPRISDYHNNLGLALKESGRLEAAISSFREAIRLRPEDAKLHNNLGLTLRDQGHLDEAIASYLEALRLNPGYEAARNNLGGALIDCGKLKEAIACFKEVLRSQPGFAEAHNNLGYALQRSGMYEEAVVSYREAIRLKPAYAEPNFNLGNTLQEVDRIDEAVSAYKEALRLKPDYVKAHIRLGSALHEQGHTEEAVAQLGQAISLKPDSVMARWIRCAGQIPVLYQAEAEIQTSRTRYQLALQELLDTISLDSPSAIAAAAEAIGSLQPFYLAFQGQNDRQLQSLYGTLLSKIQAARYPDWAKKLPMPPCGKGQTIRVGVTSAFFHYHSNWKVPIKGWIENLDRSRFSLFGYYTGKQKDSETEQARRTFSRFVEDTPTFEQLCEEILADRLHVLIYPEVGMDPVTARLAALRLAPVQCTSWGHPDTSGLPTMDFYLSSDLMEPINSEEHYTERLVRLPNLSIHYTPLSIEPAPLDRASLGIREGAVVYSCAHTVLTYLPQFDSVFPRIAREVGDCVFIFLGYQKSAELTKRFRDRLDRAFSREDLRSEDHVVILPHLVPSQFQALNRLADVLLDSFAWSACNTTLEAMAWNLPVVTTPGDLMRGRHSYAILTMMGVTETIAVTQDDYVRMAIRLGKESGYRRHVAARIAENKHRIYEDTTCIRGLEQFLENTVEHYSA